MFKKKPSTLQNVVCMTPKPIALLNIHSNVEFGCRYTQGIYNLILCSMALLELHGSGHGMPEKSTGPPSPASASKRLIMTAIAASSLPSLEALGFEDSGRTLPSII